MAKKKYVRPLKGEVYDYSDERLSEAEQDDLIRQSFRDIKRAIRRHTQNNKFDGLDYYDLTEPFEKRRMRAMVDIMPMLYERYDNPEYAPSAIGWVWSYLNICATTYSQMEHDHHMLYAAAIWILDQISAADIEDELFDRLYELLPEHSDDIGAVSDPKAWYGSYDEALIKSVVYVLQFRNGTETSGGILMRSLTSAATASGKIDFETSERENYDALIKLIPQKAIDAACEHFKELFWQWTDRFFAVLASNLRRIRRLQNAIVSNQIRYNETIDQICYELDNIEKREKSKGKKESLPFIPALPPGAAASRVPNEESLSSFLGKMNAPQKFDLAAPEDSIFELYDRLDRLEDRVNKDIETMNNCVSYTHDYLFRMFLDGRVKEDSKEVLENIGCKDDMPLLFVADPYEMCFALLYLIESGDDLPWFYGAGCGVMKEVVSSLPWGIAKYSGKEDPAWSAGSKPDIALPKSVAVPDWNARSYISKNKNDQEPRNLAQIVYEATGCVLPRDMHRYDFAFKKLSSFGIRGHEAASLLNVMNALGTARHTIKALNLSGDLGDDLSDNAEDLEEDEKQAEVFREEEDLAALKRENKRLRLYIHESEKTYRKSRDEFLQIQEEASREHRELADLRAYVFNQESGHEKEENAPEEIDAEKWPYDVRKSTLVFGGHATWAKGIKRILRGNIRFVDKNLTFDTGILRNADVIWIQPNAMSHPFYWRIVENARTLGKPVRYFTYASWAKCAEQVVDGDLG